MGVPHPSSMLPPSLPTTVQAQLCHFTVSRLPEDYPYFVETQKNGRFLIPFLRLRGQHLPSSELGSPGDVYIHEDGDVLTLYGKVSGQQWLIWPGPLSTTQMWSAVQHPCFPARYLWCTLSCQKRSIHWYTRDSMRSDISSFMRLNSVTKGDDGGAPNNVALPSSSEAVAAAFNRTMQKPTSHPMRPAHSRKSPLIPAKENAIIPLSAQQFDVHASRGAVPSGARIGAIPSHNMNNDATLDCAEVPLSSVTKFTQTHVQYSRIPVDACVAKRGIEYPRDAATIEWGFNSLKTVLPFASEPGDVSRFVRWRYDNLMHEPDNRCRWNYAYGPWP
jgi:hypothetical protein